MQIAQPGLGRVLVVVMPARAGTIVLLVRGKMIVEVPDRVRKRALLRDEQQENASKLQQGALHGRSGTAAAVFIYCATATASVRR